MNNSNKSHGLGLCGMLTLVFVILKITQVIDWSWLWILSPLWIDAILTVISIIAIIYIGKYENDNKWNKNNKWNGSSRIKW